MAERYRDESKYIVDHILGKLNTVPGGAERLAADVARTARTAPG